MDLLVARLRSNQLKFLFVATISKVEGCLVTPYPCTAA